MNKQKLLHAKHARREDPKSLVLRITPVAKGFRPEVGKSCYFDILPLDEEKDEWMLTCYDSLQQVIDEYFIGYPELKPYATIGAIQELQAELANNKNIPVEEVKGRQAYEYWECGGCQEDYLHPWKERVCPNCGDTAEGAVHAELEDVIMAGCPINWKAQEVWEANGCQPHVSSLGKEDPNHLKSIDIFMALKGD